MGGFLAFLAFVVFSILTSAAKRQQGPRRGQQPRWPGPVAPGGGFPRQAGPVGPPPVQPTSTVPPMAPAPALAHASPMPVAHHEGPARESILPLEQQRPRLTTALHTGEATVDPHGVVQSPIQMALANPESLVQAMVLSEVLGRPKALQRRMR